MFGIPHRGGSNIKKLSDQLDEKLEQDENYRLACKYMDMYTDSMVNEYRFRKENKVLIDKLDEMVDVLHEVREELNSVKQQSTQLTQSMRYFDFTRLTISMDGRSHEEWSSMMQSMPEEMRRAMPPSADVPPELVHQTPPPANASEPMPGMPKIRIVPPPPREDSQMGADAVQPQAAQQPVRTVEQAKSPQKNKLLSIISNVLFYFCMVLLVVSAISFAQNDDVNKSLFGFRYYYIKSGSMVPVYPIGSIVLTKVVDPQQIQVGDDITVYVGDGKDNTYVTHRVVEITTDQTGELAFRTKGVNNKANDPSPYNAKLVVGKVVFCVPVLGVIMTFVQNQLWLVIVMFVLLLALSFMVRLLFTKDPHAQGTQQAATAATAKPKLFGNKQKTAQVTTDTQPPA